MTCGKVERLIVSFAETKIPVTSAGKRRSLAETFTKSTKIRRLKNGSARIHIETVKNLFVESSDKMKN